MDRRGEREPILRGSPRSRPRKTVLALDIVFGALLLWLPVRQRRAHWISLLALGGLLVPIGILSEIHLGFPPVLVLIGAVSITVATALFALELVGVDFEALTST